MNVFFTWSFNPKEDKLTKELKIVEPDGKLLTMKSTFDELSNETKQILGEAYDFEEVRKEKKLVVPLIKEKHDYGTPCLQLVDGNKI